MWLHGLIYTESGKNIIIEVPTYQRNSKYCQIMKMMKTTTMAMIMMMMTMAMMNMTMIMAMMMMTIMTVVVTAVDEQERGGG